MFYRGYYPKLYLWPNQLRYNSLAEETYERYGDSIFGKTIYIIGNSYEMSDFTARTFFKVYDKDRTAEGTRVEFIDSIRDIGLVNDRMLVLREDPDHNLSLIHICLWQIPGYDRVYHGLCHYKDCLLYTSLHQTTVRRCFMP